AVALLVLAAGAARTGRVAGGLVPAAAAADRRPRRRAAARGRLVVAVVGLHPLRPGPGGFVRPYQVDTVDVADELLADGELHLLEHRVAVALELHQRVLLPVGPQADALLEVVHLVQVLAPLRVGDR